jgi:hypothetical protein
MTTNDFTLDDYQVLHITHALEGHRYAVASVADEERNVDIKTKWKQVEEGVRDDEEDKLIDDEIVEDLDELLVLFKELDNRPGKFYLMCVVVPRE